jgi:uncharacterized protein (DUF983 family)
MLTIREFEEARRPGSLKVLKCPHCGQRFVALGPTVISTRNCPHCGRRVLAEPDASDGPPPFTAKQIDDARTTYVRTQRRLGWLALVAFCIWFAGLIVLALYRDTIRDAVRPVAHPDWVFMPVFLLPPAAGLTVGSLILTRAERAAPKCPHCSAGLQTQFGSLVRVTGNCWKCGRRLLADLLPDDPAGPLPTIDEFRTAIGRLKRAANRDGILLCGLWLAVFVGLIIPGRHLDQLLQSLEDRDGPVRAALVLSGVLAAAGVVASVILIGGLRLVVWRDRKRREADPVLNCPHCRAGLGPSAQIVASRRCPACYRRVLAEPEPAAVGVAGGEPVG